MPSRSAPATQPVTLPAQRARHAASTGRHNRSAGTNRRRGRRLLGAALVVVLALVGAWWVAAPGEGLVPGTEIVRDDMQRSITGGWGTAPLGGTYAVTDARGVSVADGVAALTVSTPGSSNAAILDDTMVSDVSVRTTVSLPVMPDGGGMYDAILLRHGSTGAYQAKIHVRPDGEIRLSFSRVVNGAEAFLDSEQDSHLVLAPGQSLNVEAEVVGTEPVTLRSRAWLGSAVVPGWQQEVVDGAAERITRVGGVGLMAYLPGTSSAPATVRFAGLAASVPDPSSSRSAEADVPPPVAEPGTAGPSSGGGGLDTASGSAPLGSTNYPVPDDAVVASPAGSDDAAGTLADPVRTVERAIAIATIDRTVVLRGGTYHEKVQIPANKRLILQSYPNEQVWFDGSSAVAGWVASGSTWVKEGWTTEFDSTPCYNPGRCNTTNTAFQFVGADGPMAAHPDQVWIDGEPLRQVGSVGQVSTGSFYVDYPTDRLYIGRDPTDHEVRASDLVDAIAIRSNGSVVRGLGVRRYATPLPKIATVKADAEGVLLENLVVSDNATAGVSLTQANCTARNVSSVRNGLLGFHVSYADRTLISGVLAEGNNTEHFKQAPVAGGAKIGRSRGITVENSSFTDNDGTGVWFDESVYDITLEGNTIARNRGYGITVELSAKVVMADNLVAANTRDGVKINNTADVQIWNNTFIGNSRTIWLVQDSREATDLSTPGHDPRQRLPDPTITWLTGSVVISNNIFSRAAAGSPCVLCVEDTTDRRPASVMGVIANGNVYNRTSESSPPQLAVWSAGPGDPVQFATVADFSSATGQEKNSSAVEGLLVADDGTVVGSVPDGVAQPLPDGVARATGQPAGTRHLGMWRS